jgi:hypothetical protein
MRFSGSSLRAKFAFVFSMRLAGSALGRAKPGYVRVAAQAENHPQAAQHRAMQTALARF